MTGVVTIQKKEPYLYIYVKYVIYTELHPGGRNLI